MPRILRIVLWLLIVSAALAVVGCERDLTVGSSLDEFLVGTWEGSGGPQDAASMRIVFDGDGGALVEVGSQNTARFHCRYRAASETTALLEPFAGLVRIERLSRNSIRFHPVNGAVSQANAPLFQLVFHRQPRG